MKAAHVALDVYMDHTPTGPAFQAAKEKLEEGIQQALRAKIRRRLDGTVHSANARKARYHRQAAKG